MYIMELCFNDWESWSRIIGTCDDEESAHKVQKMFNLAAERRDEEECTKILKAIAPHLADVMEYEDAELFSIEMQRQRDVTEQCFLLAP